MSSHLLVLKYNTKTTCLLIFACFNLKRKKKLRIQNVNCRNLPTINLL